MSVLVLGAEGILGAAVMRAISDAVGSTRRPFAEVYQGFKPGRHVLAGVDITRRYDLERALALAFYDAPGDPSNVVINCAGIVKSECDKHPIAYVRAVNAEAPHAIAEWAKIIKCRVIHVSTDCVFDGSRGPRTEDDKPDATDLYGRSKAEGELATYDQCLTIRTSFIGPDPLHRRGLWEWLKASDPGSIVGYTRMMWSGLSDDELALVIAELAALPERRAGLFNITTKNLSGLYHVSGPTISKADLLDKLLDARGSDIRVQRADEPCIDRTLDGSRFRAATGYQSPTWRAMAEDLAKRDGGADGGRAGKGADSGRAGKEGADGGRAGKASP